jgi:hypothetical protein
MESYYTGLLRTAHRYRRLGQIRSIQSFRAFGADVEFASDKRLGRGASKTCLGLIVREGHVNH